MGLTKRNGVYYADYYSHGRRKRVSLEVRSKRVAEGLLAELLLDETRDKLGLSRRPSAPRGDIQRHLADYLAHLEAHGGRGGGPVNLTHAKDVRATLKRFVKERRLSTLVQLSRTEAEAWLRSESRRAPRTRNSSRETVSSRVLQKQANALKAWACWLYEARRTQTHVLLGLRPVIAAAEQLDARHARRPLTDAELLAVLDAAEAYRGICWLLMARTGLRCEELARLEWRDVVGLEGESPRLALRSSGTKNKRGVRRQPVPAGAAKELLRWREGRVPLGYYDRYAKLVDASRDLEAKVFPIVPTVQAWKRDLTVAEVPYKTPEGIADRHSLRMKFGTDLINAGHPPQVVMTLMRHSSVKLTLELYAFASDEQRRDAVEQLGGAA